MKRGEDIAENRVEAGKAGKTNKKKRIDGYGGGNASGDGRWLKNEVIW